jgi:hypothetical protein
MSAHFPIDYPRSLPLCLRRAEICLQIETLIAILDVIDGDPDIEDGDEDCCAAYDDDPAGRIRASLDHLPGDPDDAEDCDQDRCSAGDDWIDSGSLNCPGIHYDDTRAGDGDDAEYSAQPAIMLSAPERLEPPDNASLYRQLWANVAPDGSVHSEAALAWR